MSSEIAGFDSRRLTSSSTEKKEQLVETRAVGLNTGDNRSPAAATPAAVVCPDPGNPPRSPHSHRRWMPEPRRAGPRAFPNSEPNNLRPSTTSASAASTKSYQSPPRRPPTGPPEIAKIWLADNPPLLAKTLRRQDCGIRLVPEGERATICISSQVSCPSIANSADRSDGPERSLTAGEIVGRPTVAGDQGMSPTSTASTSMMGQASRSSTSPMSSKPRRSPISAASHRPRRRRLDIWHHPKMSISRRNRPSWPSRSTHPRRAAPAIMPICRKITSRT
jgi:hypothetical protein